MQTKAGDQEIVAALTEKIGTIPNAVAYNEVGDLLNLDLSGTNLSQLPLPSEIGLLTTLQRLDLSNTQLSHLPPEIGLLTSLQELDLEGTQLSRLPPEIGLLTGLQILDLGGTQLSHLPPEIGHLTSLQELFLNGTQLSHLPPEIGLLTSLQGLFLNGTQLSQLPSELRNLNNLRTLSLRNTQLSQLPAELWQLNGLQTLYLSDTPLSHLPPAIGQLTNLQSFSLSNTQLSQLPTELWQLTNLRSLHLRYTPLRQLPPEIGQLTNLEKLYLSGTQLDELPAGIWQLTRLQILFLSGTRLSHLPAEIGLLTNLQELALDNTPLSQLPAEIRWLTHLKELSLEGTQLSHLPPEIGFLTSLQELSLDGTQLSHLPPEIGLLSNLQKLDLDDTQLSQLPPEIGHLTKLEKLYLNDTQLSQLPPEIRQLTALQKLYLEGTQLSQLPPEIGHLTSLKSLHLRNTKLSQLPPEIGHLTKLEKLYLSKTQLSQLPPEIGHLINLQELSLSNTPLSQLPSEIWQLTNLQSLHLRFTQLSYLPSEIAQLTNLQELDLEGLHLNWLPPEIGQLTNLRRLDLTGTLLSQLPPEIGHLTNLQELHLEEIQLRQLPPEIGHLINLQTLRVNKSTLLMPPPEIVARSTTDILAFLREIQKNSITRYESKLLIVGEGGTGKSSLLRLLRNEPYDSQLSTTHGIEVDRLKLPRTQHEIILNTWDFGGQHIYHATHQFFFTKRSLYVIVWNARLGAEQGRLNHWLETIKALAPDSPVLLVATHTDERVADLNYQLYINEYPRLVGNLSVSNKNGNGLVELKAALIDQALRLPLMGQPWPQKWLEVEQSLLAYPKHHIDADAYTLCCSKCEVEADVAKGTLGNYLHDLGKILYFRDDYVLSNLVVLKPNWVTKAISLVLEDKTVSLANGILHHSELPRIWNTDEEGQPYETYLYPVFLRLMERFYLSYQIEADPPSEYPTRSLLPQLLPYQPPENLPPWPKVPGDGQAQVEMVYHFDYIPAGIMSWFIVRTHRYTQNLHWREGVLLVYQDHQARVELNSVKREMRLMVGGVQPHNFFTILMNTIDIILARFQGLAVERRVPCICHWDRGAIEPCPHFYSYEELVRRMEAKRYEVECPKTFTLVSVPTLLYGIHTSTDQQVMADIQQGQKEIQQKLKDLQKLDIILEQMNQQSELIGRNFTRQWNLEMQKIEANCPNTFVLMPGSDTIFNPKNWVSQEYWLYLMCQHPPGPHRAGKGYSLRKSEEWWTTVSPWLNHLITFLKFAVPMGKAIGGVYDAAGMNQLQANISLMEEMVKSLPELPVPNTMKNVATRSQLGYEQQYVGPALRALHSFLKETDSAEVWGGLHKTLTPDGNILWLCSQHRQQYEVKLLNLEV